MMFTDRPHDMNKKYVFVTVVITLYYKNIYKTYRLPTWSYIYKYRNMARPTQWRCEPGGTLVHWTKIHPSGFKGARDIKPDF